MWELIGESAVVWRFVALPAGAHSGYVWHWLCETERGDVLHRSVGGYRYYYDCLEDARAHGYSGLPRPAGPNPTPGPRAAAPGCEDQGIRT